MPPAPLTSWWGTRRLNPVGITTCVFARFSTVRGSHVSYSLSDREPLMIVRVRTGRNVEESSQVSMVQCCVLKKPSGVSAERCFGSGAPFGRCFRSRARSCSRSCAGLLDELGAARRADRRGLAHVNGGDAADRGSPDHPCPAVRDVVPVRAGGAEREISLSARWPPQLRDQVRRPDVLAVVDPDDSRSEGEVLAVDLPSRATLDHGSACSAAVLDFRFRIFVASNRYDGATSRSRRGTAGLRQRNGLESRSSGARLTSWLRASARRALRRSASPPGSGSTSGSGGRSSGRRRSELGAHRGDIAPEGRDHGRARIPSRR